MDSFLHGFFSVVLTTGLQLLTLLGPVILFGMVLLFVSRGTARLIVKVFGFKAWHWFTGWLGTPVHELGHMMFCPIFFHKIEDFSLFKPKAEDGRSGFVIHKYNPRNPWAQVGRLFISIGPLLLGTAVIFFVMWLLLPDAVAAVADVRESILQAASGAFRPIDDLSSVVSALVMQVFSAENFASWQFWVFFYVTLCISSHMELSLADLRGAVWGLGAILLAFLILNSINQIFFHADTGSMLTWTNTYSSWLTALFAVTAIAALANFLVSWLVCLIVYLIKKRRIVTPF